MLAWLCLLAIGLGPACAVKLKIRFEECLTHEFTVGPDLVPHSWHLAAVLSVHTCT